MVRAALREDVQWNRPIFKAPPLDVFLQGFDPSRIVEDLRRVGLAHR